MRYILALALALVSTGALAQAPRPQQVPQYTPPPSSSGTAGVASFNGRTGAVTLGSGDLPSHSHTESQVTNLVTDLAGKASVTHSHAESDVANLTTDLSGKAASVHSHSAATDLSGTLATARMPALTGDVTSTAGTVATTLATVNANTGTFGNATTVPVITVNAKGLVTAVSTAAITGGGGVTTFNTRSGAVTLTSSDVTTALTFTPQPAGTYAGTATATTGANGLMSATDKAKLDGIAAGATANTGTVTGVSVTTANGVSGTVATASTTPAITLTLGAITPSSVTSTGAILSSGTGGIGYTTGAGGTVTQLTSRTTGVTVNKLSGAITLFSKTTTANLVESFTVTNSTVTANDTVEIAQKSGTGIYFTAVTAVAAGSFRVSVFTPAAVGSAEAPVLQFNVIKGVTN